VLRFADFAPCLEDLMPELADHVDGFSWFNVSGDQGCGMVEPRRFDPQWARNIRDLCKERGIAFSHPSGGGKNPKSFPPLDGVPHDNMPALFNPEAKKVVIPLDGHSSMHLHSPQGLLLSKGYKRIVIGERGAYIEITKNQIQKNNLHDPKARHVYFHEYRSNCSADVMVYHQKRIMDYADYQIGLYYISPSEIQGATATIEK
jgi:hypothetical protein